MVRADDARVLSTIEDEDGEQSDHCSPRRRCGHREPAPARSQGSSSTPRRWGRSRHSHFSASCWTTTKPVAASVANRAKQGAAEQKCGQRAVERDGGALSTRSRPDGPTDRGDSTELVPRQALVALGEGSATLVLASSDLRPLDGWAGQADGGS